MPSLAIYGGTFDPIHNGHLKTAINIQNHFHFDRFLFVPCKVPVLKNKAHALTSQRLDMLRLALSEQKKELHFELDLIEINRKGPSYMFDTLTTYRETLGESFAITLIIGQDSFNQLPHWHSWEALINKANILVINRPGVNPEPDSKALDELLKNHETHEFEKIKEQASGLIYRYHAGDFNISSTDIRHAIRSRQDLDDYLPSSVADYIDAHQMYCH